MCAQIWQILSLAKVGELEESVGEDGRDAEGEADDSNGTDGAAEVAVIAPVAHCAAAGGGYVVVTPAVAQRVHSHACHLNISAFVNRSVFVHLQQS